MGSRPARHLVLGVGSRLGTSRDGIEWVTTDDWYDLRSVDYVNEMFIALGRNGRIMTSTDGLSWVNRDSGTSDRLAAVAYGKGTYVIVGSNGAGSSGTILTSADGVTWTPRSSGTNVRLSDVAFGNGTFVAVGSPWDFWDGSGQSTVSAVLTSNDGITWVKSLEKPDENFFGVTYANGAFVICGSIGDILLFSSDGANRTTRKTGLRQKSW